MRVQIIERNGKPEWAVLPYEEYLRLVEQAEMLEDIQDFDRIKEAVEQKMNSDSAPTRMESGYAPVNGLKTSSSMRPCRRPGPEEVET